MTDISEYDYHLPKELIAQSRAMPPETAKLMVVSQKDSMVIHKHVADLPNYIYPSDVVVINNTKVFHARLSGTMPSNTTNKQVEIFLVKPIQTSGSYGENISTWQAIGKPGKRINVGQTVTFHQSFNGKIKEKFDNGTFAIEFPYSSQEVITKANTFGSVPLPPYIKQVGNESDYQTIYAKKVGSVAAPTAGFHITENILTQLKAKRVQIVEITLHVGLGTFLPVKSKTIEEHKMHCEWVEITQEACDIINQTKKNGKRIIAIGTTTVRALEGAYQVQIQQNRFTHPRGVDTLVPYSGEVNIFITPGFEFKIVDCLLTNFHLPKSTLLMLVSAFAGKERIFKAYNEAIKHNYRFFSFGDAMFLEKESR